MSVDPSINVGSIIQIALLLVAMIGGFFAVKYMVQHLLYRLDRTDASVDNLSEEVKGVTSVLREQALQNLRINHVESRVDSHEKLIDDLRRGEGYILPLDLSKVRGSK